MLIKLTKVSATNLKGWIQKKVIYYFEILALMKDFKKIKMNFYFIR